MGGRESCRGLEKKRTFQYPSPFGEKTHRLVNFVEAQAVAQELGIPNVNFWTGYDKPSFDLLLATLKHSTLESIIRNVALSNS